MFDDVKGVSLEAFENDLAAGRAICWHRQAFDAVDGRANALVNACDAVLAAIMMCVGRKRVGSLCVDEWRWF